MATFISFISWTEQGIQTFRDTLERGAAFGKLCEQRGATLKDVYYCLGEYDIVGIIEAPDDETATALLLELGSVGNVRTKTVRAFNRDEMAAIMAKAGS